MKLAFAGSPEIRATREEVWRRLLDPHFIGSSTPGVESVEITGPNRFRMNLGFGVALLKLNFAMAGGFNDIVGGEGARMGPRGTAPGPPWPWTPGSGSRSRDRACSGSTGTRRPPWTVRWRAWARC